MRTRQITTPFEIPVGSYQLLEYQTPSGTLLSTTNLTNPVTTVPALLGSASITDELPYGKFEGNCAHVTNSHKGNFFEFVKEWTGPSRRYVQTWSGGYWYYLRLRVNAAAWSNPGITVSNRDWSELSYEAVSAMRPRFDEEGVSLANDIAEFRQLRDTVRPFARAGKRAQQDPNRRDRVKTASEAYLSWEFGIEPLRRNVESIQRLLEAIPKRLAALRKTAGRLRIGHYSRPMDVLQSLPAPDATIFNDGANPPFKIDREVRFIKRPTYHATLHYKLDIDRFSEVELWIRAWCEALGFTKPASIYWNAIPYSFVVDWFVSVNRFLDSVFSEPVIPIVVHAFSHSIGWKYRTRLWATEPNYAGRILAHDRTTSHYDRRRAIPATHSQLEFGLPGKGKVALIAAALIGAKLPDGVTRKQKREKPPVKINWPTRRRSNSENQAIDRR